MPFTGYRITSQYGLRTDPITKQANVFHDGIDLVKAHNAPIKAFTEGKVLYAGNGVSGTGVGGYGNVVVIQDKNNCAQVYAHLNSVAVKKGQPIKKGDVIGRQGETGKRVTGSHLHYEVRRKSSPSLGWVTDPKARTYDPTLYLKDYYATDKPVSSNGVHVVEKGDTLWGISQKYNTTVAVLKSLNKISGDLIVPGQKIKLPSNNKKAATKSALKVNGKVKVKKSATKYATGESIPSWVKGKTYTIQQVKSDRVLLKEILSWVFIKDVE